MPSSYSTNLKIELMATGENSGTWGTNTNTNLGTAMEQAIIGYGNPDYTSDANLTITISNSSAAQAARALVLNVTSVFGSLTATRELIVPTIQKQYIVQNNTTGGQSITVKTSAGTGITVPTGRKAHLYVDGTNVIQMFDFVDINGGTIDGATVGASSASTGAFTTLSATGAITLNTTTNNQSYTTTGAGIITISSGTAGSINNMTIGATTAGTGRFSSITNTGLTSGRVVYSTTGGLETDSAGLTFDGTILTSTGFAGPINGTVGATTPAAGTFTSLSDSGNLTFTGTGNRITGDFSNATVASRVAFQTSTADNSTTIMALPNGSGTASQLLLRSGSTAADDSFGQVVLAGGSDFRIASGAVGTGTNLPMTFYTGGSERVRIDTSGNVGIGTTTPTALRSTNLEVYNASGASVVVGTASTSISTLRLARKDVTDGWDINYNFPVASMLSFNKLGTNAGPLFNIDSSGNVGIGTTSPGSYGRFVVVSSGDYIPAATFISNSSAVNWARADWDNVNVAYNGIIYQDNSGVFNIRNDGANAIAFLTNGGTERMRIDSSGNVGIGTSSPAAKLDIQNVSNEILKLTSTTGTNAVYQTINNTGGSFTIGRENSAGTGFGVSAYASVLFSAGAYPMVFATQNIERMRIDSSGNVGIGTSSPSQRLQVGDGTADTRAVFRPNTAFAVGIANGAGFAGWIGGSGTTDVMVFSSSGGTERMRIDAGGNVGIGTSSSAARLGVVNDQAALSYLFDTSNATNGGSSLWRMITRNIANTGTTSVDFYKPSGTGFSIINNDTNASNFTAFNVGSSERMNIASTGIITMSAYGAGSATFSATGVISSVSDETWKIKDGVPTDPDAMLKKLEPGYWYYNDEKKETFGVDRQLGFYAQNVNAAIGPEAAPIPEQGKPWGYYDRSVLAVTVMSLQKALATIESLTARITALEST